MGTDGFGNDLIYKVSGVTSAATYVTDRILVGRGASPGGGVADMQPSWRPSRP